MSDYTAVMASLKPNHAQLKSIQEFKSHDLSDSSEIGPTWLGKLIIALQQIMEDVEPKSVVEQLRHDLPDFFQIRPQLVDILNYIEKKSKEDDTKEKAGILATRVKNMPAFGW